MVRVCVGALPRATRTTIPIGVRDASSVSARISEDWHGRATGAARPGDVRNLGDSCDQIVEYGDWAAEMALGAPDQVRMEPHGKRPGRATLARRCLPTSSRSSEQGVRAVISSGARLVHSPGIATVEQVTTVVCETC